MKFIFIFEIINHFIIFANIIFEDIPTIPELLQKLGLSRYLMDPSKVSKESLERIAVHECGHAIVEHILFPGLSQMKVSIKMDPYSYGRMSCHVGLNPTELQLMGDIAVCFGGRNAERLIYGDHCVGCAGDYEDAKKTAKDMIEKYAMGSYLDPDGVIRILDAADRFATQILQENELALRRLSKILMTQKVIDLGIVSMIVKSSKAETEEAIDKKEENQT